MGVSWEPVRWWGTYHGRGRRKRDSATAYGNPAASLASGYSEKNLVAVHAMKIPPAFQRRRMLLELVLCVLGGLPSDQLFAFEKPDAAMLQQYRRNGLYGVLVPEHLTFHASHDATVSAVIVNGGSKEETVNMNFLGQPMYALSVTNDATGEPMMTIGPATPLPPEAMKRYLRTLQPSEQLEVEYSLHIFSPELPKGRYTVRMSSLPSNRVQLIIR